MKEKEDWPLIIRYLMALIGLFVGTPFMMLWTDFNTPVVVLYAIYAGYWFVQVKKGF